MAALGDGVGGKGVCTGVMVPCAARYADARADAEAEAGKDICGCVALCGDDFGEWISSMHKGCTNPRRLCNKQLWTALS